MDKAFMCGFGKTASIKTIIKKILPETERELLAGKIRSIRKVRDVYSKSAKGAAELAEKTRKANPNSEVVDKMRSAAKNYGKKSKEQADQAKSLLQKAAGLRK